MTTLYRYMSKKEFDKMMSGETIKPIEDPSARHHTTSHGVCFIPWLTDVCGEANYTATACYEFLFGIVSKDVLVGFKVIDKKAVKESSGRYAKPFSLGAGWYDTMIVKEYYVDSYNKQTLKPFRYRMFNPKKHGDTDSYTDISDPWKEIK